MDADVAGEPEAPGVVRDDGDGDSHESVADDDNADEDAADEDDVDEDEDEDVVDEDVEDEDDDYDGYDYNPRFRQRSAERISSYIK